MKCKECGRYLGPGISQSAQETLKYMRREAPKRGGFMFGGARPAFEDGSYMDEDIRELLDAGYIAPHNDPRKGWIVVI